MPKEHSIGAVIFRVENARRLYLILHYTAGHWDFVKGHVEEDESDHETLLRELREETSIRDAHLLRGFKEKINYSFNRGAEKVNKEVIFYLLETNTPEIKISHEHKNFKWLPLDEALNSLTFENAKKILKKADKYVSE